MPARPGQRELHGGMRLLPRGLFAFPAAGPVLAKDHDRPGAPLRQRRQTGGAGAPGPGASSGGVDSDNEDVNCRMGMMNRMLDGEAPLRITETPYFRRIHRPLGAQAWKHAKEGSPANCGAYHTKAAAGRYVSSEVRLPSPLSSPTGARAAACSFVEVQRLVISRLSAHDKLDGLASENTCAKLPNGLLSMAAIRPRYPVSA